MHDVPSFARAVTTLKKLLGRKLTAYIAGVRDPSVVDLWAAGFPDPVVEKRLWLAHSVALMLCATDQGDELQQWFVTPQARLGNRSPALVIREGGDRDDVVALISLSAMGAKYG
jgi:hypothetical protein